jgi:hypothetical protein
MNEGIQIAILQLYSCTNAMLACNSPHSFNNVEPMLKASLVVVRDFENEQRLVIV